MSSPAIYVCVRSPKCARPALRFALTACLTLLPLPLFADGVVVGPSTSTAGVQRVQQVVNDLRLRLSLGREVAVSLVAENPLVVSVAPSRAPGGAFQLLFEERFLDRLNDEELRAVVAHELGHVWIFSNHPYLQTERLANSIAMRVVSRESLEQVYEKLSGHSGRKRHLANVLGD